MNVVVICSDTFRHDHLGFLGKRPVQTPNLDKLASGSAVFTDFWLCSFPTVLNRIEVFTGRYTFPFFSWGALPFEFPVLGEVFKHHGFTTGLFSDNFHVVRQRLGFERGFDVVRAVPGQANDKFQPPSAPMIDLPCPVESVGVRPHNVARYRRNAYWYRQQGTTTIATLFHSAIEWLESPPKKFFAWIDAFDPHEPWDPPEEILKLYPWNREGQTIIWPKQGLASRYSAADIENMRSLYKSEVTEVDYWIGELIKCARDRGLLADTAIIFCSDHGYYLGEHNLVGKLCGAGTGRPNVIYEEVGHIPLLIRHPEGLGAGLTISGFAQPPDLYATALDLAGIQPVPWSQGRSLVSRLRGEPSPQRFVICGAAPHRKGRVSCLTVQDGEWCLVYSPTQGLCGSELYHARTDPTHTRNLLAEHPDIAEQLFQALCTWFTELGTPRARQQRFLHNAPFTLWDNLQHSLWLSKNRLSYWRNYRHYAQGA